MDIRLSFNFTVFCLKFSFRIHGVFSFNSQWVSFQAQIFICKYRSCSRNICLPSLSSSSSCCYTGLKNFAAEIEPIPPWAFDLKTPLAHSQVSQAPLRTVNMTLRNSANIRVFIIKTGKYTTSKNSYETTSETQYLCSKNCSIGSPCCSWATCYISLLVLFFWLL